MLDAAPASAARTSPFDFAITPSSCARFLSFFAKAWSEKPSAPPSYSTMTFSLNKGEIIKRSHLITKLVELQYIRNDINFYRGTFRVRGDIVDIFPSHYDDCSWRISFFGERIIELSIILTLNRSEPFISICSKMDCFMITPFDPPMVLSFHNYLLFPNIWLFFSL